MFIYYLCITNDSPPGHVPYKPHAPVVVNGALPILGEVAALAVYQGAL